MTDNPVLVALADHLAAVMDQPLWQRLRDESIAVPGRTACTRPSTASSTRPSSGGDPEAAAFYATQHIQRVRRYMTLT